MKLKKAKREKDTSPIPGDIAPKYYFGPDEPTLQLDCWEEELSPAQLEAFKKADEEHSSVQSKLNDIVKESGGEVVYSGNQLSAYTVSGKNTELSELSAKSAHYLPKTKEHGSSKKKAKKEKYRSPTPEPVISKKDKKNLRSKSEKSPKPAPSTPTNVQSVSSGVRPSEATAIGGLATGANNKNAVVDLTKDDGKNAPDSKEVAFNKLQGKTFPSLVVVARPYLRAKEGAGNSDRPVLDGKVKSVLMHTPTKFTEWLIQQGLVRSDQQCVIHPGNKLKLGMYSDVSKFPYSGGYVWISECCPTRFVSVFSGSLFEGAIHPPSVLLKLIYHWACQTNVQNVVQWVKVDNLYVKGLFTWLRAVCTAALHHHIKLMGGPGKKIEVGVISLGTTSHDGMQRQVKVEVLGILDPEQKMIRLRAVEPLADGERNFKKRFLKILEPLSQWVHTDSIILTDLTVDKGTLVQMGYRTVHQLSASETSKNSNANIMEYLRRIVPRMFQNTLSLLSRQIIQQFLDELVWREWYGTSPGQTFDNIVLHIAEQTRLESKDTLIVRLNKISANPFKNWKYSNLKPAKNIPPPVVEVPKEKTKDVPLGRGARNKKKKYHSPTPSPPPDPPSPPPRRSGGKETRKRKRINYHEDDEDDVVLTELRKEKKPKKSLPVKEDKVKPKKKEEKVKEKKKEEKIKEKKKEEKKKEDKKEKKKDEFKISIKKEPRDESVDLEGFYFGQLEGQFKELFKRRMLVQCPECSLEFDNNVSLQTHLFSHCTGPDGGQILDGNEDAQCKYCLQHCGTPEALEGHLLQSHPVDTKSPGLSTLACLICEVRFVTVPSLFNHLQKSHTHLELPYSCGVCGYRTSSHRTCVDHFCNEHNDAASIQCPHCLKVVKVFVDGCDLQSNIEFYMEHLKQHQVGKHEVRCTKCVLRFVHHGSLKEHQLGSHATVFGARPLCSQGHLISKPKNKATPPVKDSNHTLLEIFDNVMLDIPEGMMCIECHSSLEDERHFLGVSKCSKCTYQSCCWKTLLQHTSSCQKSKIAGLVPQPLGNTMYCICSFSSDDGNVLAAHMVQCDRHSVYPSEEDAKLNTVNVAAKQAESTIQKSKEVDEVAPQQQVDNITDYPAPPSVLNTQLSLDDLAPPSVLQQDQMVEIEQLKNEAYEQPLATPQVQHEDMDVARSDFIPPSSSAASQNLESNQGLDSYMDSTGEFEPLPAEPLPQPEFEPL